MTDTTHHSHPYFARASSIATTSSAISTTPTRTSTSPRTPGVVRRTKDQGPRTQDQAPFPLKLTDISVRCFHSSDTDGYGLYCGSMNMRVSRLCLHKAVTAPSGAGYVQILHHELFSILNVTITMKNNTNTAYVHVPLSHTHYHGRVLYTIAIHPPTLLLLHSYFPQKPHLLAFTPSPAWKPSRSFSPITTSFRTYPASFSDSPRLKCK